MLRSWDFGLKNPELYYLLLSHPKNCLFRLGTGLLLAKIIFAGHGLIRILDPRFFFLSLPSRGFDLPTLGAGSRRICPQDHGAPHRDFLFVGSGTGQKQSTTPFTYKRPSIANWSIANSTNQDLNSGLGFSGFGCLLSGNRFCNDLSILWDQICLVLKLSKVVWMANSNSKWCSKTDLPYFNAIQKLNKNVQFSNDFSRLLLFMPFKNQTSKCLVPNVSGFWMSWICSVTVVSF